jgi:SAM-dependent methyltransferase
MRDESRLTHNWLAKKLVNDKVRAHLGLLRGMVVDLGCGTRPYENDILDTADYYIGVDWGNTMHGAHADVIADVAQPLPLRDHAADCVVAFDVLEHVAEPGRMLAESWRILQPGGMLMISVPFQWWVHEAPWDFYRYTRHGLEYLLGKAGFADVQVQATSGFWSMWVLKLNYQLVKLIRGPRPVRMLVRALLVPVWWLGQSAALLMDAAWHEEGETAGYFVVARKP